MKSLTVYETNKALIDTFGALLLEKYGDKLTIVHGSVYEPGVDAWLEYDRIFMDIWHRGYGWTNDGDFLFRMGKSSAFEKKVWWRGQDKSTLTSILKRAA